MWALRAAAASAGSIAAGDTCDVRAMAIGIGGRTTGCWPRPMPDEHLGHLLLAVPPGGKRLIDALLVVFDAVSKILRRLLRVVAFKGLVPNRLDAGMGAADIAKIRQGPIDAIVDNADHHLAAIDTGTDLLWGGIDIWDRCDERGMQAVRRLHVGHIIEAMKRTQVRGREADRPNVLGQPRDVGYAVLSELCLIELVVGQHQCRGLTLPRVFLPAPAVGEGAQAWIKFAELGYHHPLPFALSRDALGPRRRRPRHALGDELRRQTKASATLTADHCVIRFCAQR